MQRPVPVIGLVGDYDARVPAHQAIPLALRNAGLALKVDVVSKWVPTDDITDESSVADLDGLWCIPASPYRNTEGALLAIEHARRNGIPFLGTCGGFQHAVIKYARHVLGWTDAEHADTAPNAQRAVISALECALVEVEDAVHLVQGTRIAAVSMPRQEDTGIGNGYAISLYVPPGTTCIAVSAPLTRQLLLEQ